LRPVPEAAGFLALARYDLSQVFVCEA